MNRFYKRAFMIVALLASFLFVKNVQAGDTYNQGVSWIEGDSFVLYYGTVNMLSDSTGNFYTRAIDIGEALTNGGSLQAYVSQDSGGTADVDIELYFSNTTTSTTFLNTVGVKDSIYTVSTTARIDSVGRDTKGKQARWARIKFDGQTGNNDGNTVYWYLYLPKRQNAPGRFAGAKSTS